MKFYVRISFLFLIVLACANSYAQKASTQKQRGSLQPGVANTLLWRISGNGLKEPSYLFGTIHLNNKSLFDFGDSVYHAIESSKGFAIEVNPDELAGFYVQKVFDEKNKGKKVSLLLDKQRFNRYKKQLAAKFRKPAEEITTDDVLKEKNRWVAEYMKNGEMPTFMDAYLYNIARRQGKWLGGIEDIEDQSSLNDELVDVTDIESILADQSKGRQGKAMLEKMMRYYSKEDLRMIQKLSVSGLGNKADAVLIRRNIKMASRMDSLSSLRSMFFAVGAAHLPGDSGVIDLLERKGFRMDPVYSKSRTNATSYSYDEIDIPWVTINDKHRKYSVEMPGTPTDVQPAPSVDMKFFMDLFNLSGYYTMTVASSISLENRDSVFNGLAKSIYDDADPGAGKQIVQNGLIGKEFAGVSDDGMLRLRMFIVQRSLYVAGMYAKNKTILYGDDANKFFSSFQVQPATKLNAEEAYEFVDSIMGVRVLFPAPWEHNSDEPQRDTSGTWKITTFISSDADNGGYNILMSKEPKAGQYIRSDSTMYADLMASMSATHQNLERKDTLFYGYPSCLIRGDDVNEDGLSLRIIATIRGNRNILLMSIGAKEYFTEGAGKQMFESFKFIDRPGSWHKGSDPAKSFSTWIPSPFFFPRTEVNRTAGRAHLVTYDTLMSTSYSVVVDTLDKYYWRRGWNEFWKEKQDSYVEDGDSLVTARDVTNGAAKGKELLVRIGQSGTHERSRMIVHGNIIYSLFVSSPHKDVYSDHVNRFFSEFTPLTKLNNFDLTSSKTASILKDLQSADSITRIRALDALEEAPFTKADIGQLQQALIKSYKPRTKWHRETSINEAIAERLAEFNDPSTLSFAKKNYPAYKSSPDMQVLLIHLVQQMRTKDAMKTIVEFYKNQPPSKSLYYNQRSFFTDSLHWTREHLGAMRHLLPARTQGPFIADLYLQSIDSNLISKDLLTSLEPDVLTLTKEWMPSLMNKDSGFDFNVYSVITLLSRINSKQSIDMLNKLQASPHPFIQKRALIRLMESGNQYQAGLIQSLAADSTVRISLYEELKDLGKENLFPAKYLTQKYFATTHIYYAASEDEEPTSIEYVGDKTVKLQGQLLRVYLYKVTYYSGDDAVSYLGVAGGFDAENGSTSLLTDISGVYFGEEFDADSVDEQVNKYLE